MKKIGLVIRIIINHEVFYELSAKIFSRTPNLKRPKSFSFLFSFITFRSLESQLFNKANELQEDISLKRFDQRIAQIHLAAVKAQVSSFYIKNETDNNIINFIYFSLKYLWYILI